MTKKKLAETEAIEDQAVQGHIPATDAPEAEQVVVAALPFRKKPVVVQAVQWTGENLAEVLAFTGKHPKWDGWFASFEAYAAHVAADRAVFKIFTLEGVMEAVPGDWIIRGVQGEHYPCKPDIFAATYDPVVPAADPVPVQVDEAVLRDALARIEAGNTDLARPKLLEDLKSSGAQILVGEQAPGGWGLILHGIEASADRPSAALGLWCSRARRAIMRGAA